MASTLRPPRAGGPVRVAHCSAALRSSTIPSVSSAFLAPNTYENYTNYIWFQKFFKRSSTWVWEIRRYLISFEDIWRNASKCTENIQKIYLKTHFSWTTISSFIHLYNDSRSAFNAFSHAMKKTSRNATVSELLAKNVEKCRKMVENQCSFRWLQSSSYAMEMAENVIQQF